MYSMLRRILLGPPLPTWRQIHERLPKFLALPVFASDAVSSVAYATEEILLVLIVIGAAAWSVSLWISLAIAVLVGIVATSYRQTIFAYPHGGGSYTVARENLGTICGLVAAGSLLTDYVLTVAVSVAAGVAAVISAHPSWAPYRTDLGVLAIAVVALANLRGLRESGWLFAPPTYIFIVSLYTVLIVGFVKLATGAPIHHSVPPSSHLPVTGTLTAFLVLRAFSGGCAALTGTEAVANGIPAFKPPESKNAAATMSYMALILGSLVIGITYFAHVVRAVPSETETIVSQIVRGIVGRHHFYFLVQYATAAILILAANTAFQDFPRLNSILARDRFAPRQLANIGDRLVFSNGILLLGLLATLLIVIFGGQTHRLIPLYAVGVFTAFTLSQAGMVVRFRRLKEPGWKLHVCISGVGATVTGIVALVIGVTKFTHGAYIVTILIPLLVFVFHKVNQHYKELAEQLRIVDGRFVVPPPVKSTAIVLVGMIHKGVLPALEYARTLSHDCRALYIETDPSETPLMLERWEQFGLGVPLVILESPYRTLTQPVLKYLAEAKKERPDHLVTVVLPEFVPKKWWHKALHNQSGLVLKILLMLREDVVVTNVRYRLAK